MPHVTEFPDKIFAARIEGTGASSLSLEKYRGALRSLPPPSDAQIDNFVGNVCEAKSWINHLPLTPPGSRFHFYIDPHGGMDRLIAQSGKVRLRERAEGPGSARR